MYSLKMECFPLSKCEFSDGLKNVQERIRGSGWKESRRKPRQLLNYLVPPFQMMCPGWVCTCPGKCGFWMLSPSPLSDSKEDKFKDMSWQEDQ